MKTMKKVSIPLFLLLIATLSGCAPKQNKVNSGKVPEFIKNSINTPLIIDSNVGLGRFANGFGGEYSETDKSVGKLKAAGITGAIVYSVLSRETDEEEGNRIVLEECKKHPELIPSYVISPVGTDIDSVIGIMERNNITIARLFPVSGHFSVNPSIIGPIVEKLQNANKVLFIDFEPLHWSSRNVDYDGIYQLCKAYPRIPVVLVGSTITGAVNYPNLMAKCSNLYLEIGEIIQPQGMNELVRNGYEKRLIFGSGFPVLDPGPVLNMLAYSGLSQKEIHNICSGNLLRLLNIDYRNDNFLLKKPAERGIIDLHTHLGKTLSSPSGTETAEGIVRNMDRCGVKAAVVTSAWGCDGDVRRGNRAVAEACAKFPARLFGYITLDPKYPEEVQSELVLYGDNPSFRGIKLHANHGVDIMDKRYAPIFSFADKKGWFLLCHLGRSSDRWERICNTYKNAKFVVAHSGAQDPKNSGILELAKVAERCKNIYFDVASSIMTPGALDRLKDIAGADHITFGSDFPMFDFAYETGRIICSSMKEDEKELILYGNAKKLSGL
jgi:uncharacterized protein